MAGYTEIDTPRRTGRGMVVVALALMGAGATLAVRGSASPAAAAAPALSAVSHSGPPAGADHVTASSTSAPGKKVIYGEMSADDVRSLFEQYKVNYRNYSSSSEEEERFAVFKKNLKFIDKMNAYNPLALFGVTRFADRTDEERSKMRMGDSVSSWSGLKKKLHEMDSELATAAAEGPAAVSKLQAARKAANGGGGGNGGGSGGGGNSGNGGGGASSGDDDSSKTWIDGINMKTGVTSELNMSQGLVGWVDVEDCAACNQYPKFSNYTMGNEPDNFDWRALGAVTGVKNQAYCGSCWSFSAAADLEGSTFLKTGQLESLSSQQMVSCSTMNYGCGGGYPYAAMQYVGHVAGLVKWAVWPYEDLCMDDACGGKEVYTGTPHCDSATINTQVQGKNVSALTGWQMVALGADYEDLMQVAMLKNGPISIVLNANGMDFYVHGVVGCTEDMDCEAGSVDHEVPCDPEMLDHAVLIVGYGTQDTSAYDVELAADAAAESALKSKDDGDDGQDDPTYIPYWVIKNSWGKTWGEEGYYRVVRGSNHCGLANFAVHSVLTEEHSS